MERGGVDIDVAVFNFYVAAEFGEAFEMEVDGTLADDAAAWEGDFGVAEACDEGA